MEVLTVIAILMTILGISIGSFVALNQRSATNASVDAIKAAVIQARTKTLSGDSGTHWGVHFETLEVTVFAGSTYNQNTSTNIRYPLNRGTSIVNKNIAGGGANIIFNRLTGETSNAGTSNLGIRDNYSLSTSTLITIYGTGIVQ